ncbi:MAG: fibronectin type III domain-containing protein [bacterium]|nr:fibronectin type III domain-containing protein [bacterium]
MPLQTVGKLTITAIFLALTALEFKHVLLKTAFGETPITAPISSPIIPTPTEAPISSPEQATPTPTDPPPLTAPEQGENPTLTPTPTVTVTPTVVPVPKPAPQNNNSGSNNNSNNNGGNNGGGNSGGGTNGPSACTNEKPKSAPYLFSAKQTSKNAITLTWKKGWGPVNGYTVWYGQTKDATQYASTSVHGEEQVKSYTIGALNPYVIYYFKIQPQNGCKTGDFSNIITSTGRMISQPTAYTQSVSYSLPKVAAKKNGMSAPVNKQSIPVQKPAPGKKSGFFDFLFFLFK